MFLFFSPSAFGFRLTGHFQSAYYLFQDKTETDSSLNHIRQYQTLSLSAADFGQMKNSKGFELGTTVRLRSDYLRGPQKNLQPNFYNLYLGYERLFGKLDWRLGRQFVAFPTVGTNLDGVFSRLRPARRIELAGFYGASVNQVFPDRAGPVKKNQTWGTSLAVSTSPYFKLKAGWGARFFDGQNRFRGGFGEISYLYRTWNFYGKAVYDHRTEQLVRSIFRLTLPRLKNLSTQLEAANYKPIFYQNSIFSGLPVERYTDLRADFDYPLSERLGLLVNPGLIVYENETGYRVEVVLRADGVSFGYRRAGGLGRSYDGVFSNIAYQKGPLVFTGALDLSQFRLAPDLADSLLDEDSRVAHLLIGVGWQPMRTFLIEALYQVLSNPNFRYDNRLFLRARWRFEVKK
ncbi:MAG TPA: hypothetical protein VFR89_00795 [candidate division Zixibacteria bacterium]|nr:hypothetical protein [candidate division Zixibacteria bacterium]